MIKPIYILIIIFLSINLKADYNVSNHDPIFIKNGVFVGKNEAYSYFELEAYGVYIEKKYSPEKRENLREYIDYKNYLSFIASLSATQIANIPEFKLTPKIKLTERLAKEKAERERFTIRKNVFIDNKTGYMWEKGDSEKELSWHDAKSYCENLVLDGYSDWKLPSRDEFDTLMTAYYGEYDSGLSSWFEANKHKRNSGKNSDYLVFLPKEISQFFGLWYWTRDISKTYTSYSWFLNFSFGYDLYYYQYTNNLFRCVR
jgi:hypothetical protein